MKFKNLYCNGCSTMAGGGLEPIKIDLLQYYKDTYGVEWKSERDVMWPKLVADHFEMQIYDYSKSGAGIERFIRETYEFIFENSHILNETIFFIECPVIWNKVDIWSNIHKRYLICNTDLQEGENHKIIYKLKDIHLCDDYFYQSTEDRSKMESEIRPELLSSMLKTWSPKKYTEKIEQNLYGLISYMKYRNLKFYLLPSAIDITKLRMAVYDIDKNFLSLNIDDETNVNDFHNWQGQRFTITKETNGIFIDGHGGYFAHKRFAEAVIDYLKNKE